MTYGLRLTCRKAVLPEDGVEVVSQPSKKKKKDDVASKGLTFYFTFSNAVANTFC